MVWTLARRLPQTAAEWWMFGAIVAAVVGFMILSWWWDRSRRRGIFELLRSMGFQVDEGPIEFSGVDHGYLVGNRLLKYERNAVRWSADGELSGRHVQILEYRYTTGGGRSSTDHDTLIVSADLPAIIPDFTLELGRRFWDLGSTSTAGPIQAFGENRLYAEDGSGATVLLTPRVLELLTRAGGHRWLRFSAGTVMIGQPGKVGITGIRPALDLLDGVMNAIAAEAVLPMSEPN